MMICTIYNYSDIIRNRYFRIFRLHLILIILQVMVLSMTYNVGIRLYVLNYDQDNPLLYTIRHISSGFVFILYFHFVVWHSRVTNRVCLL